jgi:hypothetical protein
MELQLFVLESRGSWNMHQSNVAPLVHWNVATAKVSDLPHHHWVRNTAHTYTVFFQIRLHSDTIRGEKAKQILLCPVETTNIYLRQHAMNVKQGNIE